MIRRHRLASDEHPIMPHGDQLDGAIGVCTAIGYGALIWAEILLGLHIAAEWLW